MVTLLWMYTHSLGNQIEYVKYIYIYMCVCVCQFYLSKVIFFFGGMEFELRALCLKSRFTAI
jgi:uncharacterized membrane protein YeiB